MNHKPPVLLTDLQIRQFICDGFLVLQTDVDDSVHQTIDDKYNYLVENEPNPGNNIMARLPELKKIADCAVVQGALISLLGEDYFFHPHMFWHHRQPDKEKMSDEQVRNSVENGSHQDSYTPCVQAKSHKFQYLRFMYYSHDIELENGPTHIVPGSHFHSHIIDEDRRREIPVVGKAGTVFFSHFDLIHAGCPNLSDRCRNMIKFIFLSGKEKPRWFHKDSEWVTPDNIRAPFELEQCWRSQWENFTKTKMIRETRSKNDLVLDEQELIEQLKNKGNARLRAITKIGTLNNLSANLGEPLLDIFEFGSQAERTEAIYSFKVIGVSAITPLIESLMAKKGELQIEGQKKFNSKHLFNSVYSCEDECYALIVIGENGYHKEVLDAIQPLLESENEWNKLNAIHIVNDLKTHHEKSIKKLIEMLNDTQAPLTAFVKCQIVNALGSIGTADIAVVLCDILDKAWSDDVYNRSDWTESYAIHYNAAMGLVRMGSEANGLEERLLPHIDHPYGQVGICLVECLKRIGSENTMRYLLGHLQARRWDASLTTKVTF